LNTSPYPGDSGAISTQKTEFNPRRLKNQTPVLALGALGVVYGDIGTSPLYAIRECFHGHHAIALAQGNIGALFPGETL
jgi:K+ transporter